MIKKLLQKFFISKKLNNGSLKQSIETVLDSETKDIEGISKHED